MASGAVSLATPCPRRWKVLVNGSHLTAQGTTTKGPALEFCKNLQNKLCEERGGTGKKSMEKNILSGGTGGGAAALQGSGKRGAHLEAVLAVAVSPETHANHD